MQNAAGGGASVGPGCRDDSYQSIVSDLESLIERVQTSLTLIESAIAREKSLGNHDANVVALDDVTPRYLKAGAVLKACDADLGAALLFLVDGRALDIRAPKHGTAEFAGRDRQPARLIARN